MPAQRPQWGAVCGAPARQRQRLQCAFLHQDSLAVFHAQNIVRACQKAARLPAHGLRSPLPRGGKRQAPGKPFAQMPRKGRAQQGLCRTHMRGGVRRLCAVAQRLHAAQRAERAHPGGRKGLGAGRRIGRGQAQHHVCPARKRRFGAHLRGHQRKAAALHHAGAHHAHHGVEPQRAHPAYLVRMTVVERVILGNNARSAHPARLPSACRAAKMAGRPVFGLLTLENLFFPLYNKFGKEKRCRVHRNVGGKT